MKDLFQCLGLTINLKKSQLEPTQEIVFLGLHLPTLSMQVSLPTEKINKIKQEARGLLSKIEVSVQRLAAFVGMTVATKQAIRMSPLYHWHLQALINRVLPMARSLEEVKQSYHQMVEISVVTKQELVWWAQEARTFNATPLVTPPPELIVESDASCQGWGATLKDQELTTWGLWSVSEQGRHINCLELLAVALAVKTFAKSQQNVTILLRTDNIPTRAYINHFGGTHSHPLNALAMDLWKWCIERQIFLVAEHLPGVNNLIADTKSRTVRDRCDWMIHPDLFSQINKKFGPLEVELFASQLTHKLDRYFSWRPDPAAEATDAFTQSWSQFQGFANPPWCLLLPTLAKIQREKAKVVVVEDSTLVSSPSTAPDRESTSYSNSGEYSDITNPAGVHHASWSSSTGHLAIVRNQWRSGGLSEEASIPLASSWRNKTKSTYESLFKRWDSWCQERNQDHIRGPIADIMNFLAGLFEQGYQYRSVNSYRSAISSVHEKVDGEEVGKHPLVSRMIKGIFNERPPLPKYDSVWNVEAVLRWFKEQGPTDSLSLQDLTIKTTMLLALTCPSRGADLAELDLNHRSFLPEGVLFTPVHLSKQSRPSHNRVKFFFPAFKDDKNLCPVETLKVNERKTFTFRNSSGRNHLLRSFIGKHGLVTSSTVARWIKTCLHKAGIDTSNFRHIQ